MGVGDFCKLLRASNSSPDGLDEVQGQTVGVDISGIMHKGVRSEAGRDAYHARPLVPINAVLVRLSELIDAFEMLSIKAIFVFDGSRHPAKQRTDDERKHNFDEAQTKLAAIVAENRAADARAVKLWRGKCTTIRADVIAMVVQFLKEKNCEYICAPYEADFQLVFMEKQGKIQAILTEDGDLFVLGGSTLIMNLDLKATDDEGNRKPMCAIVRRVAVMAQPLFAGWSSDDVVVFAVFLGCDYIQRVHGNGLEKCKEIMTQWRTSNQQQRNAILESMNGKEWPSKVGAPVVHVQGYRSLFYKAMAMFKYAPVLLAPSSARSSRPTAYKLTPLNPLPANKDWGDVLGWDPAVEFESRCGELSYKDTYCLVRSPRYPDQDIESHILEKPAYDGEVAGFGAVIDFDAYPLNLAAQSILITWLWWRHVGLPKSTDRATLVARVQQVLDMEGGGEFLALRSDSETHGAHHYGVWEPEFCGVGGGVPQWRSEPGVVLEALRELDVVDSEYLATNFPTRPGVHSRALLRFESGHYNIRSWRCCLACLPGEQGGEGDGEGDGSLIVFEFKVTPSMKAEVYSVVLVFSALVDGAQAFNLKLSHCGCPDGCFACSHIIGAFLVIMTAQVRPDWTMNDMASFMAEPIKSIQSMPLAIDYVYKEIEPDQARLKKKLKAEMKELAQDHPGYSLPPGGENEDEEEEAAAAAVRGGDLPDICQKASELIGAAELQADESGGAVETKYQASKIDEYNERRVKQSELEPEVKKQKRDWQLQRVFLMQKLDPNVSNDNALYPNLSHQEFREAREKRLMDRGGGWAEDSQEGNGKFLAMMGGI